MLLIIEVFYIFREREYMYQENFRPRAKRAINLLISLQRLTWLQVHSTRMKYE